jgi:hypothetical protein
MTDNQIYAALISIISANLAAQSISVGIKQSYQPRQQGAPSAPTIFLHKLGDKAYGFPVRNDVYVSPGVTAHTETQNWETTFQVNALAIQNPSNLTQLTASDYLKATQLSLASESGIIALNLAGLSLLRITTIKQTDFKDEQSRWETDPSFDFTVCHTVTNTVNIGSANEVVATLVPAN